MYILVTGIDSKDYIYGLADAIRVVRADFRISKITVLPLPRICILRSRWLFLELQKLLHMES